MSKAAKRQRKKDQRRQRVEAELRDARVRRRRRLIINLSIVGVAIAAVSFLVTNQRPREIKNKEECLAAKPTMGDTNPQSEPAMTLDASKKYTASIETSCGDILMDLASDASPKTVNSFVFLARKGFYDGLTFHRVVEGFAIQGGDPKGDGSGGPGYQVVEAPLPDTQYPRGTVAMAKAGADPAGSSGSQFFIVPGDGAGVLNGTPAQPALYALLGKVVEGFDVLTKIEAIPRESGGDGEQSRPTKPIYIVTITINESPKTP